MKIPHIAIIAILVCLGCSQPEQDSNSESQNTELIEVTYYSNVSDIPTILMDTLIQLAEDDFRLANPNESFQATDLIIEGGNKPWRQLRFLQNVGNTWQMTYKHGGIGLHYHYLECKIENHRITEFITGVTLSDLESTEDIIEMKKSNKLIIRNVSSVNEIDKL